MIERMLEELGEIITGNTPSKKIEKFWDSEDIYFIKPDIIRSNEVNVISETNEYISEAARTSARVVTKNTILVTCIGSIGKIGIVSEGEYAFNQQINAIVPNGKVNSRYLAYNLLFNKPKLVAIANTSVVPIINKNQFGKVSVKIENDIGQQLEIVNVLDKVYDIIKLREKEMLLLDQLIRARFVEMFGTPYGNEKGFTMLTVDDVIEFTGGAQPDKKYFEYESTKDNIRLIQIRDYKTDNYITYIPKVLARRFCDAEDIMIGRYGPPIFQILKGIEGAYNVALMKATPKMGNKEFIRNFLKQECLFNYLDTLSQRTAGQSGIDMAALKAYPFPYPPVALQEEFEIFANQVNKSKVKVQKALDETQKLFDSLMQQYFG